MSGPAEAPTSLTKTRRPQRRTVLSTHRQTHRLGGLVKQVRMPTREFEYDFVVVQSVDERPVRFKMAFAPILVLPFAG